MSTQEAYRPTPTDAQANALVRYHLGDRTHCVRAVYYHFHTYDPEMSEGKTVLEALIRWHMQRIETTAARAASRQREETEWARLRMAHQEEHDEFIRQQLADEALRRAGKRPPWREEI